MPQVNAVEYAAQLYRDRGYAVTVHPAAPAVPPFAADLGMDLYAAKGDEHVLVRAVLTTDELRDDGRSERAAEALQHRDDGWRLDLVVLNPETAGPDTTHIDMRRGTVTKPALGVPVTLRPESVGTPAE